MNKNNIRMEYRDGRIYAQNSTRDPDDPDDDGTPIWYRDVDANNIDDPIALKKIYTGFALDYDNWQKNEKYE